MVLDFFFVSTLFVWSVFLRLVYIFDVTQSGITIFICVLFYRSWRDFICVNILDLCPARWREVRYVFALFFFICHKKQRIRTSLCCVSWATPLYQYYCINNQTSCPADSERHGRGSVSKLSKYCRFYSSAFFSKPLVFKPRALL